MKSNPELSVHNTGYTVNIYETRKVTCTVSSGSIKENSAIKGQDTTTNGLESKTISIWIANVVFRKRVL